MRFWVTPIFIFAATTGFAASVLPVSVLDEMATQARWGGPIWFGLLTGLAGVLRQRLQSLFELASEIDSSRRLEMRLKGSEKLQQRLDQIFFSSFVLAVLAYFVPVVASALSGTWRNLVAATPVGSAMLVNWILVIWARWRNEVDRLRIDLVLERREREERQDMLTRLGNIASAPPAPEVKFAKGRRVKID